MESDESDDHKNGHSSDEDDVRDSTGEVQNSDDPRLENGSTEERAKGRTVNKEKVDDSDSEPDHISDDDEDEARDDQGGVDQSECSASELVDSMEQDASEKPNSYWYHTHTHTHTRNAWHTIFIIIIRINQSISLICVACLFVDAKTKLQPVVIFSVLICVQFVYPYTSLYKINNLLCV